MEGRETSFRARASECALSRRLNEPAMHGGIMVRTITTPANAGFIETDNITGRDLGALKQNKEKHSLIGFLDYIRNVTIPLSGARYSYA